MTHLETDQVNTDDQVGIVLNRFIKVIMNKEETIKLLRICLDSEGIFPDDGLGIPVPAKDVKEAILPKLRCIPEDYFVDCPTLKIQLEQALEEVLRAS